MCVGMYVGVHTYMWSLRFMLRITLHLTHGLQSLQETQSLQLWLVSLTTLLWDICLCLLRLEL